jgi:hypothetical protein
MKKRRTHKKHKSRIIKATINLSKVLARTAKDESLTKAEHNEHMRFSRKLIKAKLAKYHN